MENKGCTVGVRDRGPGFDDELCGEEIVVADRCAKHAYWELIGLEENLKEKESEIVEINKRIKILKGGFGRKELICLIRK